MQWHFFAHSIRVSFPELRALQVNRNVLKLGNIFLIFREKRIALLLAVISTQTLSTGHILIKIQQK